MDKNKERNLSLLADFYEFTMANGYLMKNMENKVAYFDLFLEIYQIMEDLQFAAV